LAPKAQVGNGAYAPSAAPEAPAILSVELPIKGDFALFLIGTLNG
jgi:hypothetical protein